jgi:hypothetical protein
MCQEKYMKRDIWHDGEMKRNRDEKCILLFYKNERRRGISCEKEGQIEMLDMRRDEGGYNQDIEI